MVEAEQALLGAILCEPVGQRHVLDLVEVDDMVRPWHGQVLAAMHRLRARDAPPSAAEVYRELQADPDLPRSVGLDAVPLAGLMEAAPRPEHASAYAAIVVEAEIRRRLQLTGSRLIQAAEPGELEAALAQLAQTRVDLDGCAARWAAFPYSPRAEPASPPRLPRRQPSLRPSATEPPARGSSYSVRNNAASTHADPAADRYLRTATTSDGQLTGEADGQSGGASQRDERARAASAAALRDLIDDPSQLDAVGGWMRPSHFASAVHGKLYALLRDMSAARQLIDPVTVAWEAARHGLRTDPGRLVGGIGSFAVADAREVRRHSALTQITQAGMSIQADASDPTQALGAVLLTAAQRLDPLMSEPQPGLQSAPPDGSSSLQRQALARVPNQPEPEAIP